jgi:peptidoglycan/LPS O-acetylase OafA/YrhL
MGSYAAILIGSLTAIALHHPRSFVWIWLVLGRRAMPLVLFGGLVAAWQFLPDVLTGWPNLIMHSLMAAILAALVIREDHLLAPLFQWRPVARMGVISYGIYLWHLIGLDVGNRVATGAGLNGIVAAWVATPVYLVASVIIAEISFRWFESYFLKLKAGRKPRPA